MTSNLTSDSRTHQLRLELQDDSHHLRELMLSIDSVLSHPRVTENHWAELQSLLSELRDQLSLHFALEEADGYLNIPVDPVPERICDAEQLRQQHAKLFEEIQSIAESAWSVSPERQRRMQALVERFQRFRRALDEHEEAELDLIQQTLDEDLGVGD